VRRRSVQLSEEFTIQVVCASVAFVSLAVDEKRGCTVYAAAHPTCEVVLNALEVTVICDVPLETLRIQTNLARVLRQVLIVERLLVLEQHVVHRPKETIGLGRGAFGSFSGMSRVWVFRPWKMSIDKAELVAQASSDLLEIRVSHATERTLEISILNKRKGRLGRTQGMVPIGNRNCQAGFA
jgi:hypothetical protein